MNQLVEAKRIDFTSVVPDKARPDMFEKIGQPCLVIADEKAQSARRFAFSLVASPVINYIISRSNRLRRADPG